jgi:hypothetical protein
MNRGSDRQQDAPPTTPMIGNATKAVDFLRSEHTCFSSYAFMTFAVTSTPIINAIAMLYNERLAPRYGGKDTSIFGKRK